MTRIVARENSQAAEDKDPRAVRPDLVGKRRLAEHIVEDRPDPVGPNIDQVLANECPEWLQRMGILERHY